jgi:hypothetical protein
MKTKIFALSLALIGLLAVTSCSKKFTVTVNSNNEAWGTTTGSGTYLSGATATLAAVPSENCYFVKWNDDVTDNPRTITVTNDITYTAYFAEMTDELHRHSQLKQRSMGNRHGQWYLRSWRHSNPCGCPFRKLLFREMER